MKTNYQHFVERMISRYEGGYGWDRSDPGGPTKYGITCYDLAEYYGEKMDSMSAWASRVHAMLLPVADAIYERKYATACDFNELNSGCDCVVFDFGVNSGSSRSVKFSQQIVGVPVDGVLGPVTLAAINNRDARVFINALCDARMTFLRKLRTWRRYRGGWTARVLDLRAYSLKLLPPLAATLMAEVEETKDQYAEKHFRIADAFAKGYHPDDMVTV